MKTKLNNKLNKIKGWCKEHRNEIVLLGVGTVVTVSAIMIGKKTRAIVKTGLEEMNTFCDVLLEKDYYTERKYDDSIDEFKGILDRSEGRDCLMKFFVEETGEFLGEVPCTESFVNDMIDCY